MDSTAGAAAPPFPATWTRALAAVDRDWLIAIALVIGGIVMRLAWLFLSPSGLEPALAEPGRVAVSLATTGVFGDTFRVGSGPTAHLSPVTPWLVSLVYRTAGVRTCEAEVVLSLVAVTLEAIAFLFTWRAFRMLGMPRLAAFAALALVALAPVQFGLEVSELKVWEAPLVLAALSVFLVCALRLDEAPVLGWRAMVGMTVAAAALAPVSPPGSLAALGIVAVLCVRRVPPVRWPVLGAIGCVALVGFMLPWALRNQAQFGSLIWMRSNANLEIALAYNDTVLNTADRRAGYLARVAEISPAHVGGPALPVMAAAGGEVRYYQSLGPKNRAWIVAHPAGTVSLLLRHIRQQLVPPGWFFYTWRPLANGVEARRWFLGVASLGGLASVVLLVFRQRRYLYPAVMLTALFTPYIVVQPILRYHYLVSTLMMFLAVNGAACLLTWLRRRYNLLDSRGASIER